MQRKMKLSGGLQALNKSVQNPVKSLFLLFPTMKDKSRKSNLRSLKDAVSAAV